MHLAHRAPLLLQPPPGDVGEALRLGLEPLVDLLRRGEVLVDVAGLVAQVEHHAVAHGLVELVRVDVRAEDFDRALFVGLQERRAGEADEGGLRQDGFHGPVQLAGLGAVRLVDEDEELAPSLEAGRQALLDVLDVLVHRVGVAAAELVDERAEEPRRRLIEDGDEVGAAFGAVDVFAHALKDALDLVVQLDAVGDDENAGAGDVLADPLGEPDHGEALAGPLRVPDDAALAVLHVLLGGLHAEVLVGAADLLRARVEDDEVVDDLQEPLFATHADEVAVHGVPGGGIGGRIGGDLGVVLPGEVVLFGRLDRAVAQPLRVVAGQDELHGGEEGLDECRFLVVEVLPDAFLDGDLGALQLQHGERDAVDVEHHVRALGVFASTVTSSATAKSLASGSSQSMRSMVTACSPAPGLTLTP